MNASKLYVDTYFISNQLKHVPYRFTSLLSKDEIRSELNLAILDCSKRFDPKKGDMFKYVQRAFFNNLKTNFSKKNNCKNKEVQFTNEIIANMVYEEKEPEEYEMMAYLSSLPDNLLSALTEFALGKKNKEEIISNPSFKKLNIDRIIDRLDSLV